MQENYDSHTSNSTPNFVTFFFTPIYTDLKKMLQNHCGNPTPYKIFEIFKNICYNIYRKLKKEKR